MKLTKSHIASLLLMGAIFTACDDELDRPPVIVPEATIEANTSILEVKNKYWNENRNYIDTIGFNSTGEHIIVSGRIISSDETGNIYKNLVIQDETAALTISINENDMFESYHIGQEIVIDLTDMYIGKYNGLQQLGFPEYSSQYGWEATFMEMDFFQQHAQFNGLPETDKIDTLTVDIAQLEAIKSNADSLQRWQSQLVRFNNVQWVEAGKPYSEASASTNRYIKDANGNKMLVRNSSYATFRDKLLPNGTGSVVGILSYYGSGWQVLLRSTDDCIGFDESTTPDTPTGPTEALKELQETFENVSSISDLAGWTSIALAGNKEWYFTAFDNNTYAACTAYKGTDDTNGYDSWLITPAINADEMAEKVMSFESQAAYSGECALEVYAMTSTDPTTATITLLDCNIATPPASGYSGFVASGEISLAEFTGTIYIGFRYTATTSAQSMTYCIDNVLIGKKGSITPDSPETPSETSTYKKVTSITSGKEYLLVADGKAATALSSAYGYLKVIDVTDNNGVIEVADGNGFTITETTGGYTITDANSKYLYMKGTYNSFNVDTSLPSEGGVWTATPQADGSFIITNATMNKSIQYDAQYDSYGAYSDVRGTMPTLYEKTN